MRPRFLLTVLAGSLGWGTPDIALAECSAPSGVCVRAGTGVGWKAGEKLTEKQRAAEARKHAKRATVLLQLEIDGGRGSVFIDGVWIGLAPLRSFELSPGKHDLQVRDGATVLAAGVLNVPKDPGSEIQLEVAHP